MKKILALLLALALVFSLAACGGGGAKDADAGKDEAGGESTAPENLDLTAAGGFGYYNPDFEYPDKGYKIGLISFAWDNMIQRIVDNCQVWADKMNVEFKAVDSDNNAEVLISNIELFASQGYDGLIINAFSTYMDTVNDLCKELNIPWFSLSEAAVTSDGVLQHPYALTPAVEWGYQGMEAAITWMQENVDGFNGAETMIVVPSLTTLTEFIDRAAGMEQAWKELLPDAKFEICDGLSEGGITAEVGYSMCATRYTANPDVKYWIYCVAMDTFAPGCQKFCAEYGIEDNALVMSLGGDDLITLFDLGTNGAWRFASYVGLAVRFSACFHALYAVVAGWADYEDMWPDMKEEGDTYATLRVSTVIMTKDNYENYLEFCDHYAGVNVFDYGEWDGTVYTVIPGDGGATE